MLQTRIRPIVGRFVMVLGLSILSPSKGTGFKWIQTGQVTTHDDFFPASPGLESDTSGTTVLDCSIKCRQNVNCGGYVFVSDTSKCQLYQATWNISTAVYTPSARFFLIEARNPVTCPANWEEFRGSCYFFDVTSMYSSFDTATAVCTSYGGSLAHVNTEQENNFIKERCAAALNANGNGVNGCWIGLTDYAEEGTWKWADNGETVSFSDWHYDQPNEGTFSNCLTLFNVAGYDNQWTDEPCSYSRLPICEIYMDG